MFSIWRIPYSGLNVNSKWQGLHDTGALNMHLYSSSWKPTYMNQSIETPYQHPTSPLNPKPQTRNLSLKAQASKALTECLSWGDPGACGDRLSEGQARLAQGLISAQDAGTLIPDPTKPRKPGCSAAFIVLECQCSMPSCSCCCWALRLV